MAAAGLVVAGALTQTDIREAKAAQVIGDSTQAFRGGVEGTNNVQFGYGVMGRATDGWGVDGQAARAGVRGGSTTGYGVEGSTNSSARAGVYGENNSAGPSVHGLNINSGIGVLGEGTEGNAGGTGTGVRGKGDTGVWGSSGRTGYSGVYGQHTGSAGYGLVGDGTGATGAGVLGRNPNGPGIEGRDSIYGGKFAGSRAQLLLVPKGTAGKPSGTHTKGEISMDSAGTLFICVASTSTAAAKWRKVTTTAV